MSTESELRDWRNGQTNAERMCAAILAIEGYTDIDPQAPLGGPDDKKDILARRAGHRFVAAVFSRRRIKTFPVSGESSPKTEQGLPDTTLMDSSSW